MAYYLAPIGNDQQVDANGAPVSGGKIYTYLAGTTTPATTYTDSTGATPQANPIILNSLGVPASPIWLTGAVAVKMVFQDANGVQTRPAVDNITGINDPAASGVDQWVVFTASPTYVNATRFTLVGDQTNVFQVNRRIKTTNTGGTVYATVATASFAAGVTTVNVLNDSGVLDSGLSQVSYGLLSASNPSSPAFAYSTSPFRNVLINGHMLADQRNIGAAQTFTAAAALAYCVDRWYGYCTGANVTGQQITASDGTKRYRFTGAASVTAIGFGQRVESVNSLHLAGKTATLSVKLANSLLTTVNWAAYYANTADTFGTLAAPTRTAIASGTFTVSSTEATYSAQVAIPAAATTGIEIVLSVGAQTSGTWTAGDVQLEAGAIPSGAISFERPEAGENLRRCQRYLPAFNGSGGGAEDIAWGGTTSTSAGLVGYQFLVEPRVVPTGITTSAAGNFAVTTMLASSAATAISFSASSKRSARLNVTGTATPYTASQPAILYAVNASAQILFTGCEL